MSLSPEDGDLLRRIAQLEERLAAVERTDRLISASVGAGGIRSSDFVAGSDGWRIAGDGSAEFSDVTVRGSSELQSVDVTGILTMSGASAKLRTSDSGKRVEVGTDDLITIVNANGDTLTIGDPTGSGDFRLTHSDAPDNPILVNAAFSSSHLYVEGGLTVDGASWSSTGDVLTVIGPGTSSFVSITNIGTFTIGGDVDPDVDDSHAIGSSTRRWTEVWATDGTINTSDANDKEQIGPSDLGLGFLLDVGSKRWIRKGGTRPHHGPIAQDVQRVLTERGIDFAGLIDPSAVGNDGPMGLRHHEFIGPVITALAELDDRLAVLEDRPGRRGP